MSRKCLYGAYTHSYQKVVQESAFLFHPVISCSRSSSPHRGCGSGSALASSFVLPSSFLPLFLSSAPLPHPGSSSSNLWFRFWDAQFPLVCHITKKGRGWRKMALPSLTPVGFSPETWAPERVCVSFWTTVCPAYSAYRTITPKICPTCWGNGISANPQTFVSFLFQSQGRELPFS